MQFNWKHRSALVATGLIGALVWWLKGMGGGEAEQPLQAVAVAAQAPGSAASAIASDTERPSAPTLRQQAAHLHWYAAFASNDPYAAMVDLYGRRQPGSFAVATQIQILCMRFLLDMDSIGEQQAMGSVNAPSYGIRLTALNILKTRCVQFRGGTMDYMTPLSDDPYGIKYRAAHSHAMGTDSFIRSEKSREMTQTYLEQGQAPGLLDWIRVSMSPIRKSLDVSREELQEAVDIVQLRMTSNPRMEQQDLRLQYNCFRFGKCELHYDEVSSGFSAESVTRIRQAADQLEAAMRSPDVFKTVFGY